MVMLKVMHKIDPNVVPWEKVETKKMNTFKVGINCNIAIDSAKAMKLTIVGIGSSDIQDANKKLVLAIVWQLMRKHYLQIIGNKSDKELITWANA